MNIEQAKRMIEIAHKVDDTVIMKGKHGIGKSSIVKQYCKENNYELVELFLSHQEVADLVGIPAEIKIDENTYTSWSKPEWMKRFDDAAKGGKKCVLFLDELNRAQPEVLASALQLVLERQIHEHKLPEVNNSKTLVVAAINPSDEDYAVQELDPALLDRFMNITIESDISAWVKYARHTKLNKIVIDFILEHNDTLHYSPNNEKGTSPRSWDAVSKYIDIADTLEKDEICDILHGRLGKEIGSQFFKFYLDYADIIKIEDIEALINEESHKTDKIEIIADKISNLMSNMDAIQKTEMAHAFVTKYENEKNLLPFLTYLYSLPLEVFVGFWHEFRESHINLKNKVSELELKLNGNELFTRVLKLKEKK